MVNDIIFISLFGQFVEHGCYPAHLPRVDESLLSLFLLSLDLLYQEVLLPHQLALLYLLLVLSLLSRLQHFILRIFQPDDVIRAFSQKLKKFLFLLNNQLDVFVLLLPPPTHRHHLTLYVLLPSLPLFVAEFDLSHLLPSCHEVLKIAYGCLRSSWSG